MSVRDTDIRTIDVDRRTVAPSPGATCETKLIVLAGGELGRKYVVDTCGCTIGRGKEADIVLPYAEVSRRHAHLSSVSHGEFLIEDLDSRNGTLVNGQYVTRATLRYGDKIQIGDTVFLLTLRDPVEEEIIQRQRFEALGRLGLGIAHDLNNMLGVVITNLELLRMGTDTLNLEDDLSDSLSDALTAAKRAADLTPKLLAFSRGSRDGLVDLTNLVTEVGALLSRTFDRGIRIHLDIAPGLSVVGDMCELHQVIMNLCVNARDAMPEGGDIDIQARGATRAEVEARGLSTDWRYVAISIKDTGIGMDEETRQQVFEPFFTTKRSGYGIGLATSREIVTAHGGRMDVTSEEGSGSTFVILLPLAEKRGQPGARVASSIAVTIKQSGPPATILVVDDEETIRRATARTLTQLGHTVWPVSSGAEAISQCEAAERPPELVILDYDMPEMRGDQLHLELRRRFPSIRVLFMTGYIDTKVHERLRDDGALAVLHKPCAAATLLREVERALST